VGNYVTDQVTDYVTDQVLFKIRDLQFKVLVFCESPKKRKEVLEICQSLTNHNKANFKDWYLQKKGEILFNKPPLSIKTPFFKKTMNLRRLKKTLAVSSRPI
jgi:hypothetical protein